MWYLYIARCNDDTLYTGITNDIKRREREHNTDNQRGAQSLRHKRPIKIVYTEMFTLQSDARKIEVDIKGWKRKYKLELINSKRFTRI